MDEQVIEPGCDCPTCLSGISRATLRAGLRSEDESVKSKTKIALMLHNIRYVMRLIEQMRQAIADGKMKDFVTEWSRE